MLSPLRKKMLLESLMVHFYHEIMTMRQWRDWKRGQGVNDLSAALFLASHIYGVASYRDGIMDLFPRACRRVGLFLQWVNKHMPDTSPAFQTSSPRTYGDKIVARGPKHQ